MQKVDINSRYVPKDEIRTNLAPYADYYDCLQGAFDDIKSFCDVGCANGPLLYLFKKERPQVELLGLEYFQWQKDAADPSIRNNIKVCDLRDELFFDKKYDLVNCTEVGEHIDPAFTQIFINNLKKLCSKYLILSWASSGGENDLEHDDHCQHLNPLNREVVSKIMTSNGFVFERYLTNFFIIRSLTASSFHFWWRESLGVWSLSKLNM